MSKRQLDPLRILILGLFLMLGSSLSGELNHFMEVRRLLDDEADFLSKSLGFKIFGGGGLFVEDISTLELTVEVPGKLELPKARVMFVAALQDWINRVNADTQAKSYYRNFPMTADNFEFRMMLSDYDVKSEDGNPLPAFIFNNGETIVYCYRQKSGKLKPFFRENFHKVLAEIQR